MGNEKQTGMIRGTLVLPELTRESASGHSLIFPPGWAGSTVMLPMRSCASAIKGSTAISPLGVAWQSPNFNFRRLLPWTQPSLSLL